MTSETSTYSLVEKGAPNGNSVGAPYADEASSFVNRYPSSLATNRVNLGVVPCRMGRLDPHKEVKDDANVESGTGCFGSLCHHLIIVPTSTWGGLRPSPNFYLLANYEESVYRKVHEHAFTGGRACVQPII